MTDRDHDAWLDEHLARLEAQADPIVPRLDPAATLVVIDDPVEDLPADFPYASLYVLYDKQEGRFDVSGREKPFFFAAALPFAFDATLRAFPGRYEVMALSVKLRRPRKPRRNVGRPQP
jgi:hypothetical protein